MKRLLIIPVLLLSLVACSSTFDKTIATGYGTNIVVRDLATEATNSGVINAAKAQQIKDVNDRVSTGLYAAWQIRKTDPTGAKSSVAAYLKSITEIYNELKAKEVK